MKIIRLKNRKGFSIVEIILAIAIFVASMTTILYLLVDVGNSNLQAADRFTASTIAESGLEATRNIRDSGWENLANGDHGLSIENGAWRFAGQNDVDESGRFNRQVSVSQISDDRKLITVAVNRIASLGRPLSVSFSAYLTNFMRTTIMPPSWNSPQILGRAGTGVASGSRNPFGVFVLGDFAYMSADRPGTNLPEFFIFNISNPSSPTLVGSLSTGKRVYGLWVSGNYAYLATQANGNYRPELIIVKIEDKAQPAIVARVTLTGSAFAKDVVVNGNYAYVSTLSNSSGAEFFVVNISDPEHPGGVVGSREFSADVNAVSFSSDLIFAATSNNSREIQVINVQNPASPTNPKYYDNPGNADGSDILVSGNNLFLTTKNNSSNPNLAILSLDISDLNNIIISALGQMSVASDINALAYDGLGKQLFLATSLSSEEIKIVDIANPALPNTKANLDLPATAVALFYNEANLFVAQNQVSEQLIIVGPGQ